MAVHALHVEPQHSRFGGGTLAFERWTLDCSRAGMFISRLHRTTIAAVTTSTEAPDRVRKLSRVFAGIGRAVFGMGLILQGLGHAVFASRGAGALEPSGIGRVSMFVTSTFALVGFVVAGLGRFGVTPFCKSWRLVAVSAALASVTAILAFGDRDLGSGLFIDAAVLLALYGHPFRSSVGSVARAGVIRRGLNAIGVAFGVYVAVAAITRPWHQSWGSTAEERAMSLPGDPVGRNPAYEVNHAITIARPPEMVWPWLAQIGQDRGGFYSYQWLENLFGVHIVNAELIHPEWQRREIGELVRAVQPTWARGLLGDSLGWRVTTFDVNHALVIEPWGAFVLVPQSDGTTRVLVRSKVADRHAPVWGAALSFATFEIPHFIMERGMLRGLRSRAERSLPLE